MHTVNGEYSKVIIKSDSRIAIHAINRESTPSKDICNLVDDIILAKNVENNGFTFCKRTANELEDMIGKDSIHACNFISYN